jgi:hypothetical protein
MTDLNNATRMAIYHFDRLVRAENRLEKIKTDLSNCVSQIPKEDMKEYVRITTQIEDVNDRAKKKK